MELSFEVIDDASYHRRAAELIAASLPTSGTVVLTGGTTAEKIYPLLAGSGVDWSGLDVFFSDERCVPPTDDASNFLMASRLLLDRVSPKAVHRMRGEDPPEEAADRYHDEVAAVTGGFDLLLLGMGADAHIGAMFPGAEAIHETDRLCVAVKRPDGMEGLTLTRAAMMPARRVLAIVTGDAKADTVRRVVRGDEDLGSCPARALASHPAASLLLDESAASAL